MKKSIYIIKNDINNKVYIGQAINVKRRFQAHCKPGSGKIDADLVGRAINKYGKSHFWYEILEHDIENYNEREKFWIKYYKSIRPKGYNISCGGDTPPVIKGVNHPEAKLNQKDLDNLLHDLATTNISFRQLSNKYNISSTCIGSINAGETYITDNIKYPIRKDCRYGKLFKPQILEIIDLLKFTYLSYEEISKKYGVEARAIARINKGIFHKIDTEEYPIRNYKNTASKPKLTYEQVTEIIELLLTTDTSIRQIARSYNVDSHIIIGIKNGHTKMYRRKGLQYPLRSNN